MIKNRHGLVVIISAVPVYKILLNQAPELEILIFSET